MKTVLHKFNLILSISIMLLVFFACDPDNNDDENPTNSREKFIGDWTCVESSQLTYTVKVKASSSNEDEIIFENFHHLGQNENAIGIIAGYSVSITQQELCNGEWTVSGNGLMSANQKSISFQYTVSGGGTSDNIEATYSKQ